MTIHENPGCMAAEIANHQATHMKTNLLSLLFIPISLFHASIAAAQEPVKVPQLHATPEENAERIAWFRDAKFGLFIHWGPAALSGEEISWGMMDRIESGDHHKKVPRNEYMNLYKRFNPVKFDADALLDLASAAGMKYIVFVTKHHDGFSMWPTKQKHFPEGADFPVHYSIADTPYKKDPVRMVQQAAKKHGMKLGWYYSTRDWTHPDYLKGDNKIYNQYYEAQVEELMREYGPVDLMWFDHVFGDWSQYTIPHLFEKMYSINPDLLVNDRAARLVANIPAEFRPLDRGDFDTPENRMGNFQPHRAWESCMILSPHPDHGGWSYRPTAKTRSLTETIRLLSSAVCGDGNMLLNLAPLPDGSLRPEEKVVMEGLVPWMKANGEAIHATRGGPWVNGAWGGSTHRGSEVFVHVFEPGDTPLVLRGLPQKVLSAKTLSGVDVAFNQTPAELSLTIPASARDPHATIVRLTLDKPASGVIAGPAVLNRTIADASGTIRLLPAAARCEGGVRAESRLEIPNLGYWTNPDATVTWDIGISSPGKYAIKIDLSAAVPDMKIITTIAGKDFTTTVPDTGSHDTYQTIDIGKIQFPNAEQVTLRIRAADKTAWKPVNVRSVTLVPSNS